MAQTAKKRTILHERHKYAPPDDEPLDLDACTLQGLRATGELEAQKKAEEVPPVYQNRCCTRGDEDDVGAFDASPFRVIGPVM